MRRCESQVPAAPEGGPIALKISGSYPPSRWELRVDPAGEATLTRSGLDEPKTSKAVSIPSGELAEIYEQLDAADFQETRFKRSCFDCPVYTLTYGEGEIKVDADQRPRDVEAPIRTLEQLGGDPLGTADLPTR